jgi:large subunit ribosomal protein L5
MTDIKEKKNAQVAKSPAAKATEINKSPLPIARLQEYYRKEIISKVMKEKAYSNLHQVAKITKIVLTTCLGDYFRDTKAFEAAQKDFETVGLQKSVVVKAKKSIASFNLREGMNLGYKITLRGTRMYYFLDRLVNLVFVLNREFKGIPSKAISGNKKGGYTVSLGIKDISEFPEIEKTRLTGFVGLGITICTNAKNKEDMKHLLEQFNFPFIKEGK